jgi:hypothetical protein
MNRIGNNVAETGVEDQDLGIGVDEQHSENDDKADGSDKEDSEEAVTIKSIIEVCDIIFANVE